MNGTPKKQYKIARIIDEYSVVINGGKDCGIAPGDKFEILSPGLEIADPDTGESLGTLDFIKARIVARDVFPKMSVCMSQDYNSALVASIATAMIGKPAELNVASEDIAGGYGDIDETIRIGDLVRKVDVEKSFDTTKSGVVKVPLPPSED